MWSKPWNTLRKNTSEPNLTRPSHRFIIVQQLIVHQGHEHIKAIVICVTVLDVVGNEVILFLWRHEEAFFDGVVVDRQLVKAGGERRWTGVVNRHVVEAVGEMIHCVFCFCVCVEMEI